MLCTKLPWGNNRGNLPAENQREKRRKKRPLFRLLPFLGRTGDSSWLISIRNRQCTRQWPWQCSVCHYILPRRCFCIVLLHIGVRYGTVAELGDCLCRHAFVWICGPEAWRDEAGRCNTLLLLPRGKAAATSLYLTHMLGRFFVAITTPHCVASRSPFRQHDNPRSATAALPYYVGLTRCTHCETH